MSPGLANLLQPSTPAITPTPTAPPPTSPPPVSSTGSVTLSWSANGESDLAGYKIYFGTSSGNYTSSGSPAVIGKVTSYTVTGLQRNTTYFFALSAYDSAGNESALSGEASKSIL
ncbi:fibronectin type III domain-containing protein [Nitrospira lenta]